MDIVQDECTSTYTSSLSKTLADYKEEEAEKHADNLYDIKSSPTSSISSAPSSSSMFQFCIRKVSNIPQRVMSTVAFFVVEIYLYNDGKDMSFITSQKLPHYDYAPCVTSPVDITAQTVTVSDQKYGNVTCDVTFSENEWLTTSIPVNCLPESTKLFFRLVGLMDRLQPAHSRDGSSNRVDNVQFANPAVEEEADKSDVPKDAAATTAADEAPPVSPADKKDKSMSSRFGLSRVLSMKKAEKPEDRPTSLMSNASKVSETTTSSSATVPAPSAGLMSSSAMKEYSGRKQVVAAAAVPLIDECGHFVGVSPMTGDRVREFALFATLPSLPAQGTAADSSECSGADDMVCKINPLTKNIVADTDKATNAPVICTCVTPSTTCTSTTLPGDPEATALYVMDGSVESLQESIAVENCYGIHCVHCGGSLKTKEHLVGEEPLPIAITVEFPEDITYSNTRAISWESLKKAAAESDTSLPPPMNDCNSRVVTEDDKSRLQMLAEADSLHDLSTEDCALLWECRAYCSAYSSLLPKFLAAVPWLLPDVSDEVYYWLTRWCSFGQPALALALLDSMYSNRIIREYAVAQLNRLEDHALYHILPQLVQLLKHETYLDCALSKFLLRRALKAPLNLGHALYWHLRGEVNPLAVGDITSLRYYSLLLVYLQACGPHLQYLRRQVVVNDYLLAIAREVKLFSLKGKGGEVVADDGMNYIKNTVSSRGELLQFRLQEFNKFVESSDVIGEGGFSLCLTPTVVCKSVNVEKCKVLSSKKLPLWLEFSNVDPIGGDFKAIFKTGDDLRQDSLTLQTLNNMDQIWLRRDVVDDSVGSHHPNLKSMLPVDLRMKVYRCCASSYDAGVLEVVTYAATLADIQTKWGGGRMFGAFSSTSIDQYIQHHNPSKEQHAVALHNFVRTCAGYCVATYILGIGDRHADNIMITNSGHLFHIDYGHFLGNFKSKYGINRERTTFVFTTEMAYVMKNSKVVGAQYEDFQRLCCEAFNALRARASHLISLFTLMTPAKMVELTHSSDVVYMKEKMLLHLSDEEASAAFIAEIKNAVGAVSRRVDNWLHNLKHKG